MSIFFTILIIILLIIIVGIIGTVIKMLLTHYGSIQLSKVLEEFSKTLDDIHKLDFDNLPRKDRLLVSKVMCYDQSLYNHKFYGTMFDYIAYRDILANIKLSLVDILPNGRVLYRNETINDILK